MDISEFSKQLKFATLSRSMIRLGLDPDNVDDSEEAVRAILDKFITDGLEIEYECESCKGDIPDIPFCPFCGAVLEEEEPEIDLSHKSKGIPSELYRGARRGRLPKGQSRISGTKLLARLINELGISQNYIRYMKSVTSLWCHWGMISRCFLGGFSVRLHLPFESLDYQDPNEIVIDCDSPIKGMKSRLAIESFNEINEVVDILKQTVLLKKEHSETKERERKEKREKLKKPKPKLKPKKEKPKPPSRPKVSKKIRSE